MEEVISYLIKLSEAKLHLLNSLFELTLDQEKALKDSDVDKLSKILNEKKDLMKRIDVLDKEFLEKYEIAKKELGLDTLDGVAQEPVVGFKELQQKIREIMNLVQKIKDIDDLNIKQANANMNESKKQLKTVRVGKKAYSSYSKKPMEGASIFIDKKE